LHDFSLTLITEIGLQVALWVFIRVTYSCRRCSIVSVI